MTSESTQQNEAPPKKKQPGSGAAAAAAFREYLPDLDTPRFRRLAECDARSHAEELTVHRRPPWLFALTEHWKELLKEPFRGITNDGHVRPGLFELQDEGLAIEGIVAAGEALLAALTPEQRARTVHHIDSPEWRTWSNPEFLLSDKGVRLDEAGEDVAGAALALLEATLSPEGYRKATAAMRINGFLGRLVGGERVMNERSYNLCLFGQQGPSATRPWGFSFYGHHLCLSVLLLGRQIVVSPWFTGAEPNVIDEGAHAGTAILVREEALGLELMRSLSPEQRAAAVTYAGLDPREAREMPRGRWNHDDQRHLCGAYRDNRVVPYEGVLVGRLSADQQGLVESILAEYLLYLPEPSRRMRLDDCRAHFGETWFSWIGGCGETEDAFYYRVQSPVVIAEFDHHSGVFLANERPARFHVHTLLRTPNAGDYGAALRRLVPGGEGAAVPQDFVWEG